MKNLIFSALIFLYSFDIISQVRNPRVEGYVYSNYTPLVGANIIIEGTTIGTITNEKGYYQLTNLPRGEFKIRASYVGYKSQISEVKFRGHQILKIDFNLKEDLIQTENVVVSASRIEESRKDAPVIVSVLNSQTFDYTNSLNLADGLSFKPGLRLETNCQNCGFQQVRINGLEGPYSQILIDSRPIFSALNSVYGIEQIPANMIDRVEIIRGSGSVLYGSNAIAGIINIITKIPLNNSFHITSNLSLIDSKVPDQTTTLNTSLISEDYNTGIFIFGALRNRSYYDSNDDGFSEIGKINNHTLGFKSFYNPTSQSKINLEFHTLGEFRRGGNKFELQPHESDITEQVQHLINSGSIDYSLISNNSTYNTFLSVQHIERKSYYGTQQNNNAYGNTTDFTLNSGIQYSHTFERLFFSPATIITGFEYLRNKLDDHMPGYDRDINQSVNVAGAFLQNEWTFDNFKYLIGARLDKHNLINDLILSPRTTLLYSFDDNIQMRLSFSKGYRAPQAFDEDLHITAVGGEVILIQLADNLKTENSNSFSASVDIYSDLFDLQSNILIETFYTKLKDVFVLEEIGIDNNGNKIIERRNGSGAEVYGLNFECKLALKENINFQFGITIQKSLYNLPQRWSNDESISLTRQMPRTPDHYGYFTLSLVPNPKINLYLSGIYTGSMYIPHFAGYIENDEMIKSNDFFELNSKIAYNIDIDNSFNIEINGGIQNIFNNYQKDFDKGIYRDAGFIYGPSKPRTFFFGFKIFS